MIDQEIIESRKLAFLEFVEQSYGVRMMEECCQLLEHVQGDDFAPQELLSRARQLCASQELDDLASMAESPFCE